VPPRPERFSTVGQSERRPFRLKLSSQTKYLGDSNSGFASVMLIVIERFPLSAIDCTRWSTWAFLQVASLAPIPGVSGNGRKPY